MHLQITLTPPAADQPTESSVIWGDEIWDIVSLQMMQQISDEVPGKTEERRQAFEESVRSSSKFQPILLDKLPDAWVTVSYSDSFMFKG